MLFMVLQIREMLTRIYKHVFVPKCPLALTKISFLPNKLKLGRPFYIYYMQSYHLPAIHVPILICLITLAFVDIMALLNFTWTQII
ncbi:Uncharacterized protein TCM_001921 [Theobroma cacao]|uniref:Uncharacterized protein n=1 Tax=Theobroma cacao TaxID=3641 RepID=A0A061DK96_THECC|nr:Uncharacterized protein TCM_001921 [Theobroma cacao]